MFHFKNFQKQDIATMAILDGLIYAGDCGVGKNSMAIAWLLLKVGLHPDANGKLLPAKPVLIVAPAQLFEQMRADYSTLFGPAFPGVTRIRNQDELMRLLALGGGRLKPGFFLSSYTEIALNRFQELPRVPDHELPPNEAKAYLEYFGLNTIEECRRVSNGIAAGLGEERNGVQCVYRPAMAELMRGHFAAVVVDEAVRIKAEDSIVGMGIRRLNPRFRLVMTGTPVKNRLQDILFLAAWATDALNKPNERWEWGSNIQSFTEEFQVLSTNETVAKRYRNRPGNSPVARKPKDNDRKGAPSAEICNAPKLHRTLAGVVLRRRKQDISDVEIMPLHHHQIMVPMGIEQAKCYQHHLTQQAYDRRGQLDLLSKISALRTCAADPTSESLNRVRSGKAFTPKVHACLEIVRSILAKHQQVVIFSPFHSPLDVISKFLTEAHLPHNVIDGRLPISVRAKLAMNFKAGLPSANPILLAGIKACSEGNSWPLCCNAILFTQDHALDLMEQAIHRVHRINSPKPVNIYSIIVRNSIECVLNSMLLEKSAAADMVLDGESSPIQTEDMRAEDLLQIAQKDFSKDGLIDEDVCFASWPRLRQSLSNAWQNQNVQLVAA